MQLRNKKTGKVTKLDIHCINGKNYESLAEINAEWEDYEKPKEYWFIDYDSEIVPFNRNKETATDNLMKSIGNYFDTKEEAEKAVEKLKAWKRLRDKGFRFMHNRVIGEFGNVSYRLNYPACPIEEKDLDLLFGGEK